MTAWDELRTRAAELLDDPDLSDKHKAMVRAQLAFIDRLEAIEQAEATS